MTDYRNRDAPPPPPMSCQICGYVLTLTVSFDDLVVGGVVVEELQTPEWRHPAAIDADHDPVPVPSPNDLADSAPLCDFCSAHHVAGYAHATPFVYSYMGHEARDDGVWSCCTTCRAFLEAGKGNRLIARSMRILGEKHGVEAIEAIRVTQEAFLRHFTGEIADRHTRSA